MRGGEWTRWYGESWIDFLSRIYCLGREMRGKVMSMSISMAVGEVSVDWWFEKETSRTVYVRMNLKRTGDSGIRPHA